MRRWFAIQVIVFAAMALAAACGGSSNITIRGCDAGTQQACICPGSDSGGVQVCGPTGTYSDCMCGEMTDGGVGAEPDGGLDATMSCGSTSAFCAGKCGSTKSSCGTLVDCGGCPAGQTCGGGGMANVCGAGPCTPDCNGKACGASDGCGNVCMTGTCGAGQRCANGGCICDPTSCSGCCTGTKCESGTAQSACGQGGSQCVACSAGTACGTSCGACGGKGQSCCAGSVCSAPLTCASGQCACVPDCTGKACGVDDGCGGTCSGPCPGAQDSCQGGVCVCQPLCGGAACGASDGCGGACQTGTCATVGTTCNAGLCTCANLTCGTGCCASGQACSFGACCTPACGGRQCGPDPTCGANCGTCPAGQGCNDQGLCSACSPSGVTSPYATTVDSAFLAYDPSGNARIATWVPSTSQTAYLDNSSGSWQSVAFGTTNDLGVQSMALDSHGYAHACYLAWITGSTYGLQYATNASGSWVISALGAVSGDEGCILTVDASDDVHVVVFSDTSLQYLNNVGGSWSALQTVDNTVTQLTYGEVDLQVDRNGHAHIGYVDEPNSLLRYATNATGAWATATVGSAQGYAVVLAVDATGAPHLLYADGTGLSYTAKVSSGWSSPTQVLSLGSSSAEYMTGAMDEQGYYHVAFCLLDSSGSAWGNSVYASNGSGVWTSTSLTGACNGGAPSVAVSPLGSTGVAYLDGSNLLVYQTFCQ